MNLLERALGRDYTRSTVVERYPCVEHKRAGNKTSRLNWGRSRAMQDLS